MPFLTFLSPQYLLFMAPAFIVMLAAQWYVRSAYNKWSQVPARSRLTGADAAARLARSGGLTDISIEGVSGQLSDHYDPRTKVLRLSPGVARGTSVAALARCRIRTPISPYGFGLPLYLRLISALTWVGFSS